VSVLFVYDNWSAYDELSDNVPLTEELTMRQFEELLRLRRNGVRVDAYLMDAFWYEPAGAYRTWNPDRWPNGPDTWLQACADHAVLPGLWFPANTAFHIEAPEGWKDSLASDGWGFCLFHGGFWPGFLDVLRHWYGQGVRIFKFDFADFGAAPDILKVQYLPSEIREMNVQAYREGLLQLKFSCPDLILLGYNGFEEAEFMPWTDRPIRRVLDPGWLEVFDTMYCGDPRASDTPQPNFWRTLDIYADHMVCHLHRTGYPLDRIDNCSFMMGTTGTCYRRGKEAWQASYVLSLARGGKVHMTLGNLEQFTDEEAGWMAAVQTAFSAAGTPEMIGGVPGKHDWYGYKAEGLTTLVNPSLAIVAVPTAGLPLLWCDGSAAMEGGQAQLCPGTVAVFAEDNIDLGSSTAAGQILTHVEADWSIGERSAEATLTASGEEMHFLFTQTDAKGLAVRTSGGAPPNGKSMAQLLRIEVSSEGVKIDVERQDDHILWSGLSWAYAIVKGLSPGRSVFVKMSSEDTTVTRIAPSAFVVSESQNHLHGVG
jgi:hypothetical protein